MKQLGLGFLQYAQDYDEKLPFRYPDDNIDMIGWPVAIMPYVKSTQVFQCPSDPTKAVTAGKEVLSYGANYSCLTAPALSGFNATSKTVMAIEIRDSQVFYNTTLTLSSEWKGSLSMGREGWGGVQKAAPAATGKMSGSEIGGGIDPDNGYYADKFARHLEGSNFLAVDGHVKWLKAAKVSTGTAASDENQLKDQNATGNWYSNADGTAVPGYAMTFSPK